MTIEQKIGSRIRKLRAENGLSQEALAHLANLDRTYINSVENGRRNISIQNIGKIAAALQVSVGNFFDDEIFQN